MWISGSARMVTLFGKQVNLTSTSQLVVFLSLGTPKSLLMFSSQLLRAWCSRKFNQQSTLENSEIQCQMLVLWLKLKLEANGPCWPFPPVASSYKKQCKAWPSQGHHQKEASKAGRKDTKSFKLKILSSPKQHVLSLWSTQRFWRKWNFSPASKKDLWLKKSRFYLAAGAYKACSLS